LSTAHSRVKPTEACDALKDSSSPSKELIILRLFSFFQTSFYAPANMTPITAGLKLISPRYLYRPQVSLIWTFFFFFPSACFPFQLASSLQNTFLRVRKSSPKFFKGQPPHFLKTSDIPPLPYPVVSCPHKFLRPFRNPFSKCLLLFFTHRFHFYHQRTEDFRTLLNLVPLSLSSPFTLVFFSSRPFNSGTKPS